MEEKCGIYVLDTYKDMAIKYIEEFNDEKNMLTDEIEELQTDEDTEYEAKKFAKKQQTIGNIAIGIFILLMIALVITIMFNK